MTKHAFVTDFGISRMSGRSTGDIIADTTQRYVSELNGTIMYMAPELFIILTSDGDNKFRRPNKESDIYALGMTLVEFLGTTRFLEATDFVTIMKMKTTPIIPPSVGKVPSAFRVILTQCVEPDPRKRPSARAVTEYFQNDS